MKNLIISPKIAVKQALKALDKGGQKSLIIVDNDNRLLGTLSDGDLRRAILTGIELKNNRSDLRALKGQFNE